MQKITDDLRTYIAGYLQSGPVKGTLLVTEVCSRLHQMHPEHRDFDVIDFINQMVTIGDIIEVEYVIPAMPGRIKSLYFPRGSVILPL